MESQCSSTEPVPKDAQVVACIASQQCEGGNEGEEGKEGIGDGFSFRQKECNTAASGRGDGLCCTGRYRCDIDSKDYGLQSLLKPVAVRRRET